LGKVGEFIFEACFQDVGLLKTLFEGRATPDVCNLFTLFVPNSIAEANPDALGALPAPCYPMAQGDNKEKMICSSCKASDVPDHASFCPHCGSALTAAGPTAGGRPAVIPSPSDRERLRDRLYLGALLLGLAIATIVIALLIYWEYT
jgi:hypothetical protein